jgi:Predicted Co/Zn/Cd cation transporters
MDEKDEREIRAIAQSTEGVINLGNLRTRKHGAGAYVDLVICVDGNISVIKGHDIATNLEKKIENEIGIIKGITVHVEPCDKCGKNNCNK